MQSYISEKIEELTLTDADQLNESANVLYLIDSSEFYDKEIVLGYLEEDQNWGKYFIRERAVVYGKMGFYGKAFELLLGSREGKAEENDDLIEKFLLRFISESSQVFNSFLKVVFNFWP